ncbi:hypothetical protein TNCV_1310611 [Trichonephila clavipes]|nr:hypothetical protein TNCV_1310611 [Trichonephila clavipes]
MLLCFGVIIRGAGVHAQMFRSSGQSDVKPPMCSSQVSLGTAVGSLVVRASDSRPEGLGSMPPNTLGVRAR